MEFMKIKRLLQVHKYGWRDAKEIASRSEVKMGRWAVFCDIMRCFKQYYLFSNQYKSNELWHFSESERVPLAEKLGNLNKQKDRFVDFYYDNWKFLDKYTSIKWQRSPKAIAQREKAYKEHYQFGGSVKVQYGVTLICEHFSIGKIKMGNDVLLARNCDIDLT